MSECPPLSGKEIRPADLFELNQSQVAVTANNIARSNFFKGWGARICF